MDLYHIPFNAKPNVHMGAVDPHPYFSGALFGCLDKKVNGALFKIGRGFGSG